MTQKRRVWKFSCHFQGTDVNFRNTQKAQVAAGALQQSPMSLASTGSWDSAKHKKPTLKQHSPTLEQHKKVCGQTGGFERKKKKKEALQEKEKTDVKDEDNP